MKFNVLNLNAYSNLYMAVYEISKAQAHEKGTIAFRNKAMLVARDDFLMSKDIEQLNDRRVAYNVTKTAYDTAVATLAELVAIQDKAMTEAHSVIDSDDVYKAYKAYISGGKTETLRLAYIETFARSNFDFCENDIVPVDAVAEYMYFGEAKSNAYKNKLVLKADGRKKFLDMSARATINRLIKDGLIDTSKLVFTSKKLAKIEAKAAKKINK